MLCWLTQEEDGEHERESDTEADLADPPDAVADPAEDGAGGHSGDGPDDGQLGGLALGDVRVHVVETLVDLNGPEAEAGADSEQRGDH